jgi:ubiquinone biosynthesis protein COQ9
MKKLLTVLFAGIMLAACNSDQKKMEALKSETDAIHDAAMKDLADMNRVARAMKGMMISDSTMSAEKKAEFEQSLIAIGEAENNMTNWMMSYKVPETPNEAVQFLEEKKTTILANQQEIKTAMENGKKLLGN